MRYEAIYARQSIEKKNSLSIHGQEELCRRAAGTEDIRLYQDRGYSGKNTARPDFQRLLQDIRADKIQKLYVYRLDRFSRSIADFSQLWKILQEHQVEFVSVTENFDTATPMGRAMLHIIMVFAQLERETTSERVHDNYISRAASGAWPGGPAPYGYEIGRSHDANGRSIPTLFPNDETSRVVQFIFQEYAQEDASLGSIVRKLNDQGVACAKRDFWDNVSLSRILHNPVYVMADEQVYLHYKALGVHVDAEESAFDGTHNAFLYGKREANERKYTDVHQHTLVLLGSVGIVPSQLWLLCQEKLRRNAQIGNAGKGKHTWLSGLLKCAKCGYSIKIQTEKQTRRMICSGRYNNAHCDASIHVDLTELEDAVTLELEKLLAECPVEAPAPEKDVYAAKLEELDRRADRLMDAFSESEDMSSAYLHRALARLEQERKQLLEQRRKEAARPSMPDRLVFAELSFEEKKAVAAQFIDRIEIAENSVHVLWSV